MKKQVIFEAIINEAGILCIRIPGLDPVIGAEGPLCYVPANMGKRFWKKILHVFKQECSIRFGSERQLPRVAIIREKIELIERGRRRGTGLVSKRREK